MAPMKIWARMDTLMMPPGKPLGHAGKLLYIVSESGGLAKTSEG
jgi:hypothetical protein